MSTMNGASESVRYVTILKIWKKLTTLVKSTDKYAKELDTVQSNLF